MKRNINLIVAKIEKAIFNKLFRVIRKLLNDENFLKTGKGKDSAFTRKRKMTLQMLIISILKGSNHSLQIAIDDFFEAVKPMELPISKQAYSKARTNIRWEIFRDLFYITVKKLNNAENLILYNEKYHLIAIDGSRISLDNAKELKNEFGCCGKTNDATTGLCSIAVDVLNNIILDANLCPFKTNERDMAMNHIDNISKLGVNAIYLFDRGYPSIKFMWQLIDTKQKFLMRVRNKFNVDIDFIYKNSHICINHDNRDYRLRVIKVTLNSGVIETLLTNLTDEELSAEFASELYFMRWGVESKFDVLKNKLELENFSGKRILTTYQDFWAKLTMANLTASLKLLTDQTISLYHNPTNKYNQYTNQNRLINKFHKRFLKLIFVHNCTEITDLMLELVLTISRKPEQDKPNRTTSCKNARNRKHNPTGKTVL